MLQLYPHFFLGTGYSCYCVWVGFLTTHAVKPCGRKASLSQSHLFYQGLSAFTKRLKRAGIYTARCYALYKLHRLLDTHFTKRGVISSFPSSCLWRALQGPKLCRKCKSLGVYIKLCTTTFPLTFSLIKVCWLAEGTCEAYEKVWTETPETPSSK